jgi:hypothetical protein
MAHWRKRNPPRPFFDASLARWGIAFSIIEGTLLFLALHATESRLTDMQDSEYKKKAPCREATGPKFTLRTLVNRYQIMAPCTVQF